MATTVLHRPVILYETLEALYQYVNETWQAERRSRFLAKAAQRSTPDQQHRLGELTRMQDSLMEEVCRDVDREGNVLSTQYIAYGAAAEKPDAPTHDGYVFLGWDTDTACVKEDLTVIALYEKQDVPTDPTRPTDPEKPENPTEPTKPGTDSEPQTPPTGDGAAPRLAALAGCAALLAAGLMLQSRKRKRQS